MMASDFKIEIGEKTRDSCYMKFAGEAACDVALRFLRFVSMMDDDFGNEASSKIKMKSASIVTLVNVE
jgi:hypothetical protein